MRTMLIATIILATLGCRSLAQLSDADLAKRVYSTSKFATYYGLSEAIKKYPDKADKIKTDIVIASKILKESIIPLFSGATSEQIVRQSIDVTVALAASAFDADIANEIKLAANTALDYIDLPSNPADKLSDRVRLAILALFQGMSDGMDQIK